MKKDASAKAINKEKCTATSFHDELKLPDFVVERRVVEHDGVIDLILQRIERVSHDKDDDGELVLRLELDGLRNTDGAHFRDTHTTVKNSERAPLLRSYAVSSATIQDDRSKMTVLVDWVTQVRSPAAGVMEFVVLSRGQQGWTADDDEPKRIRVILEDVNPLHDKMTEFYPSSFGKLVMHDFIDPLELYYDA